MGARSLISEAKIVEDLTTCEVGDINLWIGQQKEYRNVPNYISDELCYYAIYIVSAHNV